MLALLLITGALDAAPDAGVGVVDVPSERMAAASRLQPASVIGNAIPLGAAEWRQPYDPGDHSRYAADWADFLGNGVGIASIVSIRMSAAAASLGIMIDQSPTYAPIIDSAARQKIRVFFKVDPALQEAGNFDASGTKLPVSFRITTDEVPSETFERTWVLTVRQQ